MYLAKPKPGLVCTFYSYKGGVGRSMALANVAVLLSRLGQKVLVIDWDLEAPGLEQYFGPQHRQSRKSANGLVDFIGAYGSETPIAWRDCLLKARVPQGEAVDIFHAGRDDEHYSERLRAINWDKLFQDGFGRYLEDIRGEWKKEYAYILVDSRTGITDIGGICSILLPDYLISLFTTNEQSVLGVKDAMTRARAAQSNLPLDRQRLIIIPIAARDESNTEYRRAAEWRQRFARELSGFYDDWIHKDETAESVLDYLKIPYIAYWSFGEQLPVLEEDASNPKMLAYSYALIARLIHSRLDWSEVREGREASEMQAQRAAEIESRRAEADKIRLEAMSQQQAEANRLLEQRKAALFARFSSLNDTVRRQSLVQLSALAVGIAVCVLGGGFLLSVINFNRIHAVDLPTDPLFIGAAAICFVGAAVSLGCFFSFRSYREIYDALNREYATYTIAHGRYADLTSEQSLRVFGDRIELIAQGEERRYAVPSPSTSSPSYDLPAAANAPYPAAPPPLPTAPSLRELQTIAPAPHEPSSSKPAFDDKSPIDVMLTYANRGIARDWVLEFAPLFTRWLSEILGRSITLFDASALDPAGDAAADFRKAASVARTAIIIISGRMRESDQAASGASMLLDRIQPDRLFPIRLDASPSRAGSAGPLADLKSADFSDLAYIGEGFAKSERYIEFQDRVRRLANDVAAAIERTETSQLA